MTRSMDTVNKRSIFRFSRPRLPVFNDWFENLIEIYQKMVLLSEFQ